MELKHIAIIGANGFMGSHLVRRLATLPGCSLMLYGRSNKSIFGDEFPYTQLDLRDTERYEHVFKKADIVYHLASETIPATSWDDPVKEIEGNLIPYLRLLEHLVKIGVKKFAFISSAGTIYGPSKDRVTEHAFTNPFSPHGITKLTMEHYLNYYHAKYGLNYDVYRVSNVYGEGQNTGKGLGIINTFLEKIQSEGKVTIYGTGETVRNYVYVKDAAELLSHSVITPIDNSGVYNVSSNDTLSINELVRLIREVVNADFKEDRIAARQSDNPIIDLDNSKILAAHPNFRFTGIKEGITQTSRHMQGNK